MSIPYVTIRNLSVGYHGKSVVDGINAEVYRSELFCLIGPNGSGKSTLLRTLTRELPSLKGRIFLEDTPLEAIKEMDLARRSAAVLTGKPTAELMLCEDVVAAGRYPYTGRLGILGQEDKRILRESMALVGVDDLYGQEFSRLSDGQRQRVLLARALCQEPKLLLLDEPTSFLDIRHKLEFLTVLRKLARDKQIAVILSLHELELAQKFSDRILCLRDGKVAACGTPEEIFTDQNIRELFGIGSGSYDCLFATAEPERSPGLPRIFVIGGGGSGIPVYRRLQRLGIPFAAGVLPENDMDLPVAKALAATLITDRADEPISTERVEDALRILRRCEAVICTRTVFGTVTRENERLLRAAEDAGLLCCTDAFVDMEKEEKKQ